MPIKISKNNPKAKKQKTKTPVDWKEKDLSMLNDSQFISSVVADLPELTQFLGQKISSTNPIINPSLKPIIKKFNMHKKEVLAANKSDIDEVEKSVNGWSHLAEVFGMSILEGKEEILKADIPELAKLSVKGNVGASSLLNQTRRKVIVLNKLLQVFGETIRTHVATEKNRTLQSNAELASRKIQFMKQGQWKNISKSKSNLMLQQLDSLEIHQGVTSKNKVETPSCDIDGSQWNIDFEEMTIAQINSNEDNRIQQTFIRIISDVPSFSTVAASDSAASMVGNRVSVMWSTGRSYSGTIDRIEIDGKINVEYDDGTTRSYKLKTSTDGTIMAFNKGKSYDVHTFTFLSGNSSGTTGEMGGSSSPFKSSSPFQPPKKALPIDQSNGFFIASSIELTLDLARSRVSDIPIACRSLLKMMMQSAHPIFQTMDAADTDSWGRVALSSIEDFVSEVRYGQVDGNKLDLKSQSMGACLELGLGLRYGSMSRLLRAVEQLVIQEQAARSSGSTIISLPKNVQTFLKELSTMIPGYGIKSFTSSQYKTTIQVKETATEIEIETLINSEMTFKCVIGRGVGCRNSTDLDDRVGDGGGVSPGDIIAGVLCDGWIHISSGPNKGMYLPTEPCYNDGQVLFETVPEKVKHVAMSVQNGIVFVLSSAPTLHLTKFSLNTGTTAKTESKTLKIFGNQDEKLKGGTWFLDNLSHNRLAMMYSCYPGTVFVIDTDTLEISESVDISRLEVFNVSNVSKKVDDSSEEKEDDGRKTRPKSFHEKKEKEKKGIVYDENDGRLYFVCIDARGVGCRNSPELDDRCEGGMGPSHRECVVGTLTEDGQWICIVESNDEKQNGTFLPMTVPGKDLLFKKITTKMEWIALEKERETKRNDSMKQEREKFAMVCDGHSTLYIIMKNESQLGNQMSSKMLSFDFAKIEKKEPAPKKPLVGTLNGVNFVGQMAWFCNTHMLGIVYKDQSQICWTIKDGVISNPTVQLPLQKNMSFSPPKPKPSKKTGKCNIDTIAVGDLIMIPGPTEGLVSVTVTAFIDSQGESHGESPSESQSMSRSRPIVVRFGNETIVPEYMRDRDITIPQHIIEDMKFANPKPDTNDKDDLQHTTNEVDKKLENIAVDHVLNKMYSLDGNKIHCWDNDLNQEVWHQDVVNPTELVSEKKMRFSPEKCF